MKTSLSQRLPQGWPPSRRFSAGHSSRVSSSGSHCASDEPSPRPPVHLGADALLQNRKLLTTFALTWTSHVVTGISEQPVGLRANPPDAPDWHVRWPDRRKFSKWWRPPNIRRTFRWPNVPSGWPRRWCENSTVSSLHPSAIAAVTRLNQRRIFIAIELSAARCLY